MTFSEVMTLMDKGFTAEQVMQLTGGKLDAPTTDPDGGKDVDNPPAAPGTGDNPAPAPADNPQDPPDDNPLAKEVQSVIDSLKGLRSEMEQMKKTFQMDSIKFDSIHTPAQVSADDALAELIRPKYNTDTK